MDVLLLDAGLAACFVGLASVVRPLRLLRIRTRAIGALVMAGGGLVAVVAAFLPTGPIQLPGPPMRLDRILPVYQFGEHHEILVHAPPDRVYRALRSVTADEIRLFRLLTWLRSPHLPGRGRESILNAPESKPILDVALASGFVLVAEEPGREIVVGTAVCCDGVRARTGGELAALTRPGVAKALMNFHLADEGGGVTRLTTQTRIFATDPSSARRFGVYWRVIYPGSATIRWMWLRAVRARAEVGPSSALKR